MIKFKTIKEYNDYVLESFRLADLGDKRTPEEDMKYQVMRIFIERTPSSDIFKLPPM